MKGRNKLLLGVVVLLLLVLGVVVVVTGRREPSYQGKSLSYWVMKASQEDTSAWMTGYLPQHTVSPEVQRAIRSIGTNGIPFYLEWLPYQPSRSLRIQMSLAKFSQKFIAHKWQPHAKIFQRSRGSSVAFSILETSAAPAIPKLAFYATNESLSPHPINEVMPIQCLAEIGRPAVPALVSLMANGKSRVKDLARSYFNSLHGGEGATSQLELLLYDADPGLRRDATNALELLRTTTRR